ncbi:hypothetical protein ACS0TY_019817 [Phlomoides rotata]
MAGLSNSLETDFESSDENVKRLFDEFLRAFLTEVYGASCLRPVPPVIGEGQAVDLLKLHCVVKKRGGYHRVSKNGLWSSVVEDCGFDLKIAAALKLVYVKYLDVWDRWLRGIDKGTENLGVIRNLMDWESDSKVFISGVQGKVEIDEGFMEFKKKSLGSINEEIDFVKLNADKNGDKSCSTYKSRGVNVNVNGADKGSSNGDELSMEEEDTVNRKRKRDECCPDMLDWIISVAKDPCCPGVEALPERQKWKCFGSELPWKQILLFRELMISKRNADAGPLQYDWQKKQKMHPSMYDDGQCGSEKLRCSQRLQFSKDSSRKPRERGGSDSSYSGNDSDEDVDYSLVNSTSDSLIFPGRKKRIPIGRNHQADLPEFCGCDYQSDYKWLGSKVWPLDKAEQRKCLIERDPIGRGRQDSCGCQLPGSIECVRFHVRQRRLKLKLELGTAFYMWKFNGIGEDVALSWTKDEESKFHHIVESNRLSCEKYFWDELFKFFPRKGREALVSYYFNVFLLQRRGHQNRSGTSNIDSDDEDSEYGPIANRFGQLAAKSPGSIFCSPNKSHVNSR